MTTTYVDTKWVARVTRIDNTTEREYRYVHLDASPDPRSINKEEDVCRLAYDLRQRYEQDTSREGVTYEVEIQRTEVATTTKTFQECKHHAAIVHPEHGCAICSDIKMDEGWEEKYPELAGKI